MFEVSDTRRCDQSSFKVKLSNRTNNNKKIKIKFLIVNRGETMSYNPFSNYISSNTMSSNNSTGTEQNQTQDRIQISGIPELVEMEGDVDQHIMAERTESIHDIQRNMLDLNSTWIFLSSMISDQGENIDIVEQQTVDAEENTTEGVIHLEKAVDLSKDRLIMIRNISLVVGGGILGAGGLFFGPLIGVGTIIAGGAAGGAAATGINKLSNK